MGFTPLCFGVFLFCNFRYLVQAELGNLSCFGLHQIFAKWDGKISYTTCREILRDSLNQLGFNRDDYGLHSIRSGGITSVVRHSGNSVSERLLKLHGRWKTDDTKDMYVVESLDNRLEVTKFLGL